MLRRSAAFLWHLALVFLCVSALGPRLALAAPPTVSVAVLAFDSDDAKDHADALTGALRSRVRTTEGWSLIETTQSLGTMTATLKCWSRPSTDCQDKIAEQLVTERYIFGFVTKGPASGQVTAEVHLYQKGKADTFVKETYADGNDDALRTITARILMRLGGSPVDVEPATTATAEPAQPVGKVHTRQIIGGASMGAGVVLGTIAVIEILHYFDLQKRGDARAEELPKSDPSPCKTYDATCSQISKDSKVASAVAMGLGVGSLVALGVGAYLIFSDPSSEKAAAAKTRVIPTVGAGSTSLTVVGTF
jgi:hypothetical protein